MKFLIHEGDATREIDVDVRELIIAGMTGRDMKAVQAHLDELAELDIPGPSTIPVYYRVSINELCQSESIQALSDDSSGEIEAVLIGTDEGMLVAVGSDHTNRKVESYSIAVSKQMCAKPVSRDVWRYADLLDVWDDLELNADRFENGKRIPYQRGTLATVRKPEDLIAKYFDGATVLPAGYVMFTGTFATLGEIIGGERFEMELVNKKTGQKLAHGYDIVTIPVVD